MFSASTLGSEGSGEAFCKGAFGCHRAAPSRPSSQSGEVWTYLSTLMYEFICTVLST